MASPARSTGTATTRVESCRTAAVSSGVSTVDSATGRSFVASAITRRLSRRARRRNSSEGVVLSRSEARTSSTRGCRTTWSGMAVARISRGECYTRASTMRLTTDEIEFISRKIVKTLVAEEKLEVDDPARVVADISRVITDELRVEDRLNEEVREKLMEHATEMERSNVTYTEMFKMLKKKMAREKGIIL